MPAPQANGPIPSIPLDELLPILSHAARWILLRELPSGDQLMVLELAERVLLPADVTSKHLALLRKAGAVVQGRNRLYQIAPQFVTDKIERILDFGHRLLRLNASITA